MDGSYLFQPEVIAASRQFVCLRLVTYEDKDEALFLKSITRTRSGEVENSAFAMLAPDGTTKLLGGGRGMDNVYADAKAMVEGMNAIMRKQAPSTEISALPLTADVRIGIDVAAADTLPLVVICVNDESKRAEWNTAVAKLAWSSEFVGRFIYASTSDVKDLAPVEGVKETSAVFVIQSDRFGLKGKVLSQTGKVDELVATLSVGAKAFVREEKSSQAQVRDGRRLGIFWETKTPVTDPGEAHARDQTKHQQ